MARQATGAKQGAPGFDQMMDFGRYAGVGQTSATALAHMNAQVWRGWLELNAQLLEFTRHRLQEDVETTEQLSRCKNMSETIDVIDAFYRKAFSEYSDEFGTLLKLGSNMASQTLKTAEEESKHIVEQANGDREG